MHIINRAAIGIIRAYQIALSPFFGSQCKFEPSCSQYACDCFKAHGSMKSAGLVVWRLLRCNPWSHGGYDPAVQPNKTKE